MANTVLSQEPDVVAGRRLVLEGRLIVREVTPTFIRATCRDAGDVYSLGFKNGAWWCECRRVSRCVHLVALQQVCDTPRWR